MSSPIPTSSSFLSSDQRRHLTASLGAVERNLRAIATIAGAPERGGRLVGHRTQDLPPSFGRRIAVAISDAQCNIDPLLERLHRSLEAIEQELTGHVSPRSAP